jgi:hypothetical protein
MRAARTCDYELIFHGTACYAIDVVKVSIVSAPQPATLQVGAEKSGMFDFNARAVD